MKINRLIIVFLSLILVSCELESEIYDKINPDIFPTNEAEANALVTASAYHVFSPWGIFNVYSGYALTSDMVTDIGDCSWAGWEPLKYNEYEANTWLLNDDSRRIYDFANYISSMTLTLDRLKDVPMRQEMKDRFLAEVKCGRGFLSFLMYDLYGPIPIADLSTLKDPAAEKILPRLTEEKMREFIETNLLEAREHLPYRYEIKDYGRFTKGLANTVLLKFYMSTAQWEKAVIVGRELLKSEYGYDLEKNYNDIFTLEKEVNSETIFASTAKKGEIEQVWHAHVLTGDYPTDNVVTKWGGYKVTWPFYESYDKDDRRLQRLVGEYTTSKGLVHNKANDRDGGSQGTLYLGAIPVKYSLDATLGEKSEIDMPVYRFADVLTLLAEAIVRHTNNVDQEALSYLNRVRVRSLPGKAYKMEDVSSVNVFLEKVLEERGHEFYFEGVRRQDLIRHGKFIEYAVKKAEYAGAPTGKIVTQVDGQYKYLKFPFPVKIITEGQGIIKQNPGY